ncbi:FAD-dependent monooxygenase [Ensifer adhaerens]|uniref:FAD-dependent monooxygenase n=1 Tax=Ensifer adhaerens TaxID=106592 RepID=UPI00384BEDA9
MSKLEHAIVVGAGIGGLAAASALASHFEKITVLERDELPNGSSPRSGVAQSAQLHFLLQGGLAALCEIFPGLDLDLAIAGAVPIRYGLDDRRELPGFDPFPQFDFGVQGYAMSRPFVEQVIRQRINRLQNVTVRERCRATDIMVARDGLVSGVTWEGANGSSETLRADLVIDASGRGALTLATLKSSGRSQPEQTTIGVDILYATTVLTLPESSRDWKIVITVPSLNEDTKAGALIPIEGGRWMAVVAEWHAETPVIDQSSFLKFTQCLRTPTIYDAIKGATSFGRVERFGFPESYWRHFERLDDFPQGLIPIGDAMCRFNPVYGQGMSVALKEAALLKTLLDSRTCTESPLEELTSAFFTEASAVISTAWSMAAVPDLIVPKTRGERPADLQALLKRQQMLNQVAALDPEIYKVTQEIRHLVKPQSALHHPDIVRRLEGAFTG